MISQRDASTIEEKMTEITGGEGMGKVNIRISTVPDAVLTVALA